MEHYTFKHATKVFAVDYESAKEVSKVRGKKVPVIPNGVDINKFRKRVKKPKVFKYEVNVLFVGRLIPSKGVYDIIRVSKQLSKEIGVYIIGKGPEKDKVKKMCDRIPNCHFIGFVNDVTPYLKHADIFVMPSYYEGMPIVLLEAMAARTACIAYDIGDIKKRFKSGKELVILTKGDISKLEMWINKLAKNKKLRQKIAENGFKKVKKEYSWDKIVKEIITLVK